MILQKPYYNDFVGLIEQCGESNYMTYGKINVIGQDKIEILELPIGTWTNTYKEKVLEPMLVDKDKTPAAIK